MGRRILVSVTSLIVISFVLIYVYVVFRKRYAALKPFRPEQIHLSYGEKSNDIVLTWLTWKDPRWTLAIYGFNKGPLSRKINGTSTKFTDNGLPESTRTIHRVVLKNLEFNTAYKCRVGSLKAWSGIFTFKTPPAGEDWAVKALVFGGLSENTVTLPYMIKDVDQIDYSVIIHAGDIAKDMSKDHGVAKDNFMNAIQPLATKVPYMVCPGNLEQLSNYSHYKERFTMPKREKYQNMFYSFNLGSVHFVSINTEAYCQGSKSPNIDMTSIINQIRTQYNWLKRDLADANNTANRRVRPWIIMYGYHPMLCSRNFDRCMEKEYEFPHRVGNSSYGGYGLEQLLKDYGVDLSIWHQNSYERLWPVYNKTVYNGSREAPYTNPRAPVHVTTGAAGNDETSTSDDFVDNPPAWSAFRSRDCGYSRLSVRNATHLFFEQLALKNNCMKQVDSFWLVREKHVPYVI